MRKIGILAFMLLILSIGVYAISVSTPTMTPADPKTANNLICTGTVTDDNDTTVNLTVYVEWLKEGAVQASLATNTSLVANNTVQNFTLLAANTAKNQNWSCRLNATNTSEVSDWTAGATNLTINDTCPTSTATVSPVNIYDTTETVTGACGYADTDSDTEGTSTYKWFIDGVALTDDTDTSLSNANFSSSQTIEFECTPINTDCDAARAAIDGNQDNSTSETVLGSGGGGTSGGSSGSSSTGVVKVTIEEPEPAPSTTLTVKSNAFKAFFEGLADWFRNLFK